MGNYKKNRLPRHLWKTPASLFRGWAQEELMISSLTCRQSEKTNKQKKNNQKRPLKDISHRAKPNAKPRQCNVRRAQDSFLGTLRLYFETINCYRNIGMITILSQINSSRTNTCSPWRQALLSYYMEVSWQKWEQAMAHGIVWKCWSTKQVWHFAEPLPRNA